MATRFYGANVGASMPIDVLESGSTTSRTVEVAVVYDAVGANKQTVLNALEAIKNAIIQDEYPPV
jgi:hypothetical protein